MAEDWEAVGQAITIALEYRQMTQLELAAKSGVSPATIREIQYNKLSRRRNPRILAALSEALGWSSDHLDQILNKSSQQDHMVQLKELAAVTPPPQSSIAATVSKHDLELTELQRELRDLRARVAQLENDNEVRPR